MNVFSLVKFGAALVALIFVYWWGYSQGANSEELKNARAKIETLSKTVSDFQERQSIDSAALVAAKLNESNSRAELDRLRNKLRAAERSSQSNADKRSIKCFGLGIEGAELLEEARRAIKFCEQNHR